MENLQKQNNMLIEKEKELTERIEQIWKEIIEEDSLILMFSSIEDLETSQYTLRRSREDGIDRLFVTDGELILMNINVDGYNVDMKMYCENINEKIQLLDITKQIKKDFVDNKEQRLAELEQEYDEYINKINKAL